MSGNRQVEAFTEAQPGCVLSSENILLGGRPCPDKGKATVMSNVNGESDVTPTESQTTGMVGNFPHGSREAPETSAAHATDRSEKARGRTSDMHVSGESDSFIVPQKQANNGSGSLSAESVEGRGLTEENVTQWRLDRTQCRDFQCARTARRARSRAAPSAAWVVIIRGRSRMR